MCIMKFAAPLYKTLVNLLLIFNLVLQGILGLCLTALRELISCS